MGIFLGNSGLSECSLYSKSMSRKRRKKRRRERGEREKEREREREREIHNERYSKESFFIKLIK